MKKTVIVAVSLLLLTVYAQAKAYYHSFEETTTNLGVSEEYESGVIDVTNYETVDVNVTSDQDSATDGLKINFVSVDGDCSSFTPTSSNMDYTANGSGWSYTASSKDSYSASVRGNCAWVTFTNGSTLQSSFKLTIFGTF